MNYWSRSFLDYVCIMFFCIFGILVGFFVLCKLSVIFYDLILRKSVMFNMDKSWYFVWKIFLVNVCCCGKVYYISRIDKVIMLENIYI